jgi:hypothetical protein
MRRLSALVAIFALYISTCFITGAAQSPRSLPRPRQTETLNREAEASDPAGVQEYSRHLIGILLGERAGTAYAGSVSDRLARAELMARSGKRNPISEETIARAFNDLMRRVDAPKSLSADVQAVDKARRAFEKEMPAVISREKNAASCNPGEAVWVLAMLLENIGSNPPQPEHPGPYVSVYVPPARQCLTRFFSFCSYDQAVEVLDGIANDLGI